MLSTKFYVVNQTMTTDSSIYESKKVGILYFSPGNLYPSISLNYSTLMSIISWGQPAIALVRAASRPLAKLRIAWVKVPDKLKILGDAKRQLL